MSVSGFLDLKNSHFLSVHFFLFYEELHLLLQDELLRLLKDEVLLLLQDELLNELLLLRLHLGQGSVLGGKPAMFFFFIKNNQFYK